MKQYWLKKGNKDLILFFNGWGCDELALAGVEIPGWDILILSDYSEMDFCFVHELEQYRNIRLLAWSFGVFAAGIAFPHLPPVSRKIAVNGTPWPIDDKKGIPVRVFEATLTNYNEENRNKFFERVLGSCSQILSHRSTTDQLRELTALRDLTAAEETKSIQETAFPLWDTAIICESDKIFPPRNMKNAWQDKGVVIPGEHFPDFPEIIDRFLLS